MIELELSEEEKTFYERLVNNQFDEFPIKSVLVMFLRARQASNGIDAVDPDYEPNNKPYTRSTKLRILMQKIKELRTAPKKDRLVHVSKKFPERKIVRKEVEHAPQIPKDGKFVIFSQFKPMLELIKYTLEQNNIGYCFIDGKSEDRQYQIDEFNNNPKKVSCSSIV